MIMPTGGPKNVMINKQPVMNNNLIMGKMPPNGPMMARGIRPQQGGNLAPNMGPQRHQVGFESLKSRLVLDLI
jgi:hypothetical protein